MRAVESTKSSNIRTWGCVGSQSGVLNSEYADHDLLSGEAQAACLRLAGSSFSTPARALGKRNPQGHFDWRCSFSTLKQGSGHKTYYFQIPETGLGCSELGEGQPSIPGHEWTGHREQGTSTYDLQGGWGGGHLLFLTLTLSGYFKGRLGTSKVGTDGALLNSSPSRHAQSPACHTVKYLDSNSETQTLFVSTKGWMTSQKWLHPPVSQRRKNNSETFLACWLVSSRTS